MQASTGLWHSWEQQTRWEPRPVSRPSTRDHHQGSPCGRTRLGRAEAWSSRGRSARPSFSKEQTLEGRRRGSRGSAAGADGWALGFTCLRSPRSCHQPLDSRLQPFPQPAGRRPALRLLPRGHQGRDDLGGARRCPERGAARWGCELCPQWPLPRVGAPAALTGTGSLSRALGRSSTSLSSSPSSVASWSRCPTT